jgi:predicted permease
MKWFQELFRRFSFFKNRQQFDQDLQEEMRLHLDLRREEYTGTGLDAAEAHAASRRKFGNVTYLQEESRTSWSWIWLEQTIQDLRYAAQNMLRTPGFNLIAILVLALGIGANSAIFSIVNAVLLRPLAYKDSDRLVTLLHRGTGPVSPGNYVDWKAQSQSFEDVGAAEYWTPNLTGTDTPEKLYALRLTQNIFPILGVPPMLGRTFSPGEDRTGNDQVAVLGYKLWQRRFGGDSKIVGQAILLNGVPHTVVGVMPPDFQFAPFWATRAELWVPLPLAERATSRGGNSLRIFARLKPGVSVESARAEIATVTAHLEQQYPGTNREVRVTPLKENVIGKVETPLLVLMGAVGLVLLIACANVAHMLLARAAARQKEIAVRSALGAGGWRLIRQFLAEGLLLSACGAIAGIGVSFAAVRGLVAIAPASIPRLNSVTIDPSVVLFCLLITFVTGVAFSLAPAMHAKTLELSSALKETARGSGGSVRLGKMRDLLTTSEIALAFMLLIGAGLLVRSFTLLRNSDPGFDPAGVASMIVSVEGTQHAGEGRRESFYRRAVEQLQRVPGVQSASAINHLPLAGDLWGWPFEIEGRPTPRPGEAPIAVYRIVMPGYFQTMRLPIVRGREIQLTDDGRAPGVVVVSEAAAQRCWPGEDPIGKRISFGGGDTAARNWLTVVGVAKDAKQYDWAAESGPEIYLAALQNREFLTAGRGGYITLVARTAQDPAHVIPAMKEAVWSLDRNVPISQVLTMSEAVDTATAQPRFEVSLLGLFAGAALLLAAIGIHALMSFAVARRTQEIGVRISLGATQGDVSGMILRQGMKLALAGCVAGGIGSLLLSRLMEGMLYGVRPADPLTFVVGALVLNTSAFLAAYLPARRAARIDPIIALRNE